MASGSGAHSIREGDPQIVLAENRLAGIRYGLAVSRGVGAVSMAIFSRRLTSRFGYTVIGGSSSGDAGGLLTGERRSVTEFLNGLTSLKATYPTFGAQSYTGGGTRGIPWRFYFAAVLTCAAVLPCGVKFLLVRPKMRRSSIARRIRFAASFQLANFES